MALVDEAIQAGIFNDLGSGGNVDICILSKSKGNPLPPHTPPLHLLCLKSHTLLPLLLSSFMTGRTMLRNYQKPTLGRYVPPKSRPFPIGATGTSLPPPSPFFHCVL